MNNNLTRLRQYLISYGFVYHIKNKIRYTTGISKSFPSYFSLFPYSNTLEIRLACKCTYKNRNGNADDVRITLASSSRWFHFTQIRIGWLVNHHAISYSHSNVRLRNDKILKLICRSHKYQHTNYFVNVSPTELVDNNGSTFTLYTEYLCHQNLKYIGPDRINKQKDSVMLSHSRGAASQSAHPICSP